MSNNLANPDTPNPPYYVATHKNRSAVIKRDADYQTTIKLVQKSIPSLRSANVQDIFISTTLADCGDGLFLISEEIWPELVNHVKAIEVTLEDQPAEANPTPSLFAGVGRTVTPWNTATLTATTPESPAAIPAGPDKSVSITVQTVARKSFKFTDLPISKTISEIKSLIEAQSGVPAALQWLDISGKALSHAKTLEKCGITKPTSCRLNLCTRQTMIYLFLPRNKESPGKRVLKNVEIKLLLDRAWELEALLHQHPPQTFPQSVSWTVDVHEDGKLVDPNSQTELSCLFWDGILTTPPAAIPPLIKQTYHTPDQLRSMITVEPGNSVVLRPYEFDSYVSSVFKSAGFEHSSAFLSWVEVLRRTSFRHLAVRFLPQSKYEAVAPLSVSQCPQLCKVRFVVLYKGLSESEAALWDTYRPTHDQGPGIWNEIIGLGDIAFHSNLDRSFVFEVTSLEVSPS